MLQKCSITKTASIFFNEPSKEHYLMEISRKIDIAHTSVKNHLKELLKMQIITKNIESKGKRKFPVFRADFNNSIYKNYKSLHNLEEIKTSGLIPYLKDRLMPNCIVLFGSYQKGEDDEQSDIDIFIESKKTEINLLRFENSLKRKIQLHFKRRFKEYPKELKNNIANGIVLDGYLEVL